MEAIVSLQAVLRTPSKPLRCVGNKPGYLWTRLHESTDRRLPDSMQRTIDRGATLTQQLLWFARKQPLKVDNRNPNDLIEGCETVLRRAGTSGIQFEFALAPNLQTISIDTARFERTPLNLVVNARDAMTGDGRITISTENFHIRQLPLAFMCGRARDSGIQGNGLSVRAVFHYERHWQDTRLGISQVYGFIVKSSGDVTLESQPG